MIRTMIFIFTLLLSSYSLAGLSIYPADGQSPEQQQKDEGECYTWATGNSGYDPANPPNVQAAPQPSGPSGARLRGAAAGALVGELSDGDTGKAAVTGAVLGASRERRSRRRGQQEAEVAVDSVHQAGMADFNKAKAACLEGRGYSVK